MSVLLKRRLLFALATAGLFLFAALPSWSANAAPYSNGQTADLVLGQPNFTSSLANNSPPNGVFTNTPQGVFVTTYTISGATYTFVADSYNNRVLIWHSSSTYMGQPADYVLGQSDFTGSQANFAGAVTAFDLNTPQCVYSDGTKLYVCDTGNNRVLIWNAIPSTNTVSASVEIGQTDMTGSAAATAANGLNWPRGIWKDKTGALYIADTRNNRVVIFASVPGSNNASATNVLGQTLFGGCPSEGQVCNNSAGANNYRNNATSSTFYNPSSVFVDTVNARTYVTEIDNNRVLVFFSTAPLGMRPADLVLGQPNFTSNDCNFPNSGGGGTPSAQTMCTPIDVNSDGIHLFVTEFYNARVLIWNEPPTVMDQAADVVIGQADFVHGGNNDTGNGATELCEPTGARFDPVANQLFVSDSWCNMRVQVWNGVPTVNGQPATYTLGGGVNPSATSLHYPRSLTFGVDSNNNDYLYIADMYNYRIMLYNLPITMNAQPAFNVLGQTALNLATVPPAVSATTFYPQQIWYSSNTLYMYDGPWYRMLVWKSSITVMNQPADLVVGQANMSGSGCNAPGLGNESTCGWWDWPGFGIWASTSEVVLADTQNNRVLFFSSITVNEQAAKWVLGQPDFVHNQPGAGFVSNGGLWHPSGIAGDATHLYVSDTVNSRVLVYHLPLPSFANITAAGVPAQAQYELGQATFTYPYGQLGNGTKMFNSNGASAQSMSYPHGVWAAQPPAAFALYVNDTQNSRTLGWLSPISSNRQAADFVVGQGDFSSTAINQASVQPGANTLAWTHGQVWGDDNGLYIADGGSRGGRANNRILIFQPAPNSSGPSASSVLGQQGFATNSAAPPSLSSLDTSRQGKGMCTDGNRFALADGNNNRMLLWNSAPQTNDQSADLILGQPSPTTNGCNYGGLSGASMCVPKTCTWDGLQFFVTDSQNNRILVWNGWPTSNHQSANYVIGQPDFAHNGAGTNGLQKGLNRPQGIYSDGNFLWIADHRWARVLQYNLPITPAIGNGEPANIELGQPVGSAWTTGGANQAGISAQSLNDPKDVVYDGRSLFVSDERNSRELVWTPAPTTNDQAANLVLGQAAFNTGPTCTNGIAGTSMCYPAGTFSDGVRLYVSDWQWHRILFWNEPPSTTQQTADGMLGSSGALNVGNGCGPDNVSMCWVSMMTMEGPHMWAQNPWANRALRWSSTQNSQFYVNITSALVPATIMQPPTVSSTNYYEAFKFVVSAPVAAVNWNTLTVFNNGWNNPLPDQCIQIQLFKDNVGDGQFRPTSDTNVGIAQPLGGGQATINFSQGINSTPTTYFLAVEAQPNYLPFGPSGFPKGSLRVYHNFVSFGMNNPSDVMAPGVPVGVAYNSGFFTPVDYPDPTVFAATSTFVNAAPLLNNTSGLLLATLTMNTTNDFSYLNTLLATAEGTDGGAGIAGINLILDTNQDGVLDTGDTMLLGSSATFVAGQSFLSPLQSLTLSTQVITLFVTADLNGTAQNTTFALEFDTASFSLVGTDFMSMGSTTPFLTGLLTFVPAIGYATATVPTSTWWSSTFAFTMSQGQANAAYFRAFMDNSPTHAWSDTEQKWTTAVSTFYPPYPAQNWYAHFRVYSAANKGGNFLNLGPFWFDNIPTHGYGYEHLSSSGGWISEKTWDLLTSAVTAQILVEDFNSGLNLNGGAEPGAIGGTVGLWHLDEGVGTTANDSSGNGNTGTLTCKGGACVNPSYTSSPWTTGVQFSGSQGITVPNAQFAFAANSNFTIEAWINPLSLGGAIAGVGSSGGNANYLFTTMANGALAFTNNTGGGFNSQASVVATGKWQHVAMVAQGATITFYVNGGLVATGVSGSGGNAGGGAMPFSIGTGVQTGGNWDTQFSGSIDEVRVLNFAAGAAQIVSDYNSEFLDFAVLYSSTSGNRWTMVTNTAPGGVPFVDLSGSEGTTSTNTLTAANFSFYQSTVPTTCNGVSPCTASNQIIFVFTDQAGNQTNVGPYAVLSDSTTPLAISTPTYPSGYVNIQPNFAWTGPSTTVVAGILNPRFDLKVSSNDPTFAPANIVITISTPIALSSNTFTADGAYASTFTLTGGATYYWRVSTVGKTLGTQSVWSSTASFTIDFGFPVTSQFASISSTGGVMGEGQLNNLATGVSAAVQQQEGLSGLGVTNGAVPFAGDGHDDGTSASGGYGVMYSTNAGASWIDLSSLQGTAVGTQIWSLGVFNGKLYAGDQSGRIYVNSGGAWGNSNSGNPLGGGTVWSLAVLNGKLYAGTNSGKVYVSVDGNTWPTATNNGNAFAGQVQALTGFNGHLYAGDNNGKVWVMNASSSAWSATNGGAPVAAAIQSLVAYNGQLYAGGSDGKVYVMNPNGGAWSASNGGAVLAAGGIVTMAAFNGSLYAAGYTTGKVYVSADGNTWNPTNGGTAFGSNIYALAAFNGKLYAADNGDGEVWVTPNGNNWTVINSGASLGAQHMTSLTAYAGSLYAGNSNGSVYKIFPLSASLPGADGTTSALTETIAALNLVESNNTFACAGAYPCASVTDQVLFTASDLAGNSVNQAFAILVDTVTPAAISAPSYPPNSAYMSSQQPSFIWTAPAANLTYGLGPGAYYLLQVSNNDPTFSSPPYFISIATPVIGGAAQGAYVSTFTLANNTTYYWEVSVINANLGAHSAWSGVNSFVTDFVAPSVINGSFVEYNSTGGAILETQWNELPSGVTAQITVQDTLSGMAGDNLGPSLSYLKFNEGLGATAHDSSGNGYNLNLINGPAWIAGYEGTAINLTGTTYGKFVAPIPLGTNWTIESRIQTPLAAAGSYNALAMDANLETVAVRVSDGQLGSFAGGSWNGTGYIMNGLAAGWHNLTVVGTGGTQSYYIDGAYVGQVPVQDTNHLTTLASAAGTEPWGGIDDFRVANYAASPDQIITDMTGGAYALLVSSDAGNTWAIVNSTLPVTVDYIGTPTPPGNTSAQPLIAYDLPLALSTVTTTCGGVGPCAATNQVEYLFSDQAGNVTEAGPYGFLIDTPMSGATAILTNPPNGGYTGHTKPTFTWQRPNAIAYPGLSEYYIQVSSKASFTPLSVYMQVPVFPGVGSGSYVSTTSLITGTTYYWQVRELSFGGLLGPWSPVSTFETDFVPPFAVSYVTINSTGGAVAEYQFNDLAAGVTAQVTVQDVLTGLNLANPPDAATAAFYQFEEGVGTTTESSANGGNQGNLVGGATFGPGLWGEGLKLDGSSGYLSVTNSANLIFTNSMSVGAWVNPTSELAANTAIAQMGNGTIGWYLGYSGGQVVFWAAGGAMSCGTNAACATASIPGASWSYVVGTYDGTNLCLYLNGNQLSCIIYTGGIGKDTTDPLIVGSYQGAGQFFGGTIDDVRLYSYPRSPAQIQADAAGSTPPLAMYSNNAGFNWTIAGATYPVTAGAPYLSIGGFSGIASTQPFQLSNVTPVESTSTLTGAKGTNQIKFLLTDLAGNQMIAGPYALLFDSESLTALSTPTLPGNGAYVNNPLPTFNWQTADLAFVTQYELQVSPNAGFSPLTIDITTPAVYGLAVATYTAIAALAENTTFYWRVQADTSLNRQGPWSQVYTFVTDYSAPSTSTYRYYTSTGGAIGEGMFTNLTYPVTAQVTVTDLNSGLAFTVPANADTEFFTSTNTVGLWHFDEGAGAVAHDVSGFGNNGAAQNGPPWVNGVFGKALSLNGGNQGVLVANAASLNFTTGMTLEAWVKPANAAFGDIMRKDAQFDLAANVGASCGGTGTFGCFVNNGSSFQCSQGAISPAFAPSYWYFVTCTYDQSKINLYVNGVWTSSFPVAGPIVTDVDPVGIGYDGNTNTNYLNGVIDEARILNASESPAQVLQDYVNGGAVLSPYYVQYSTTGGTTWSVVTSTTGGAAPYIALTGTSGTNSAQSFDVYNLGLVQSSNTLICAGANPCGATNQVIFYDYDRAGNLRTAGPFDISVDTTFPVAVSTPTYPANTSYINFPYPEFVWSGPSTATNSGLNPYILRAARNAAFTPPLDISISTPDIQAPAAAYLSTFTLLEGPTYYWQVAAVDNLGNLTPYSITSSFILDITSPSVSLFASLSSTGGAVAESLPNDMTAGTTAQLVVQDLNSGLAIANGGYGVMYTTNAGTNWVDWSTYSFTTPVASEIQLNAFTNFKPSGQNLELFAGTGHTAQVIDTQDGVNWSQAYQSAGDTSISAMAVFNGLLFVAASPSGNVYHSANATIWTQTNPFPNGGVVTSLGVFNGRLYAGTSPGAIIYATADGVNWSNITNAAPDTSVASLLVYNGKLFAATSPNSRIFGTSDGFNWRNLATGVGGSALNELAVFNGAMYGGSGPGAGIFKSTDGITWASMFTVPGETSITSIAVFDGKLYAGTSPNGKLFASTNGSTWNQVLSGLGETGLTTLMPFGGSLFAGTAPDAEAVTIAALTTVLTGADGTLAAQTLSGEGLNFVQSSNLQICGGVGPCSATNQVVFTVSDRAGNVTTAGPYAVIVDTVAAHAQPIPGVPNPYAVSSLRPEFTWGLPSGIGLGSVPDFQFDLSASTNFVTGLLGSSTTANRYGNFLFNLTDGSTYYWRVRSFSVTGASSTYTGTQTLIVDTDTPVTTNFVTFDSVNNAVPEPTQLNLAVGVTAQITVQDATSGIQLNGPAPLAPIASTVLLLHLDDGGGTNLADASINANNGTVTSPVWDNGIYGKALRFNGTSGNVASVPYSASMGVSSVTVEAWVNSTSAGPANILTQDGGAFTSYSLYMQAGGAPTAWFGGTSITCGAAVVNDGRWHNIAATRDGGFDTLYVDGTQCAQTAASSLTPTVAPFLLAEGATGSGPYFFGIIDEVRVLKYGLSGAQIAADYSTGNPFFVRYSTNASQTWNFVTSVTPGAAPYISYSGGQFYESPQVLQLHQFALATSTNGTTCGGAAPCGATNQILMTASDRAGNVRTYGPFAVLVDTTMNQPTAIGPANATYVSSAMPAFTWSEPSPVGQHQIWVATDPAFGTLTFSAITNNFSLYPGVALADATTYYWKVRAIDAIGLLSVFSSSNSFVVDLDAPVGGQFAAISSTGGLMGEAQFSDLAAGATAQISVQDILSGMPRANSGLTTDPGTEGLWHFDTGQGLTAVDSSGHGNNANIAGATWIPGRYGYALNFNGAQTANVPYNASLNTPLAMTVEAWIKTTASNVAADGEGIVTRWSGGAGFELATALNGYGGSAAIYTGVGANWLIGQHPVNDGNWHHVAATYDGTTARMYVDGSFDGSAVLVNGLANTVTPLTFGSAPNDASAVTFIGAIDDVRLLNYARTPAQINGDYNGGPSFYIQLSTNAGNYFQNITSTYAFTANSPYVGITGTPGSTSAQSVQALNLTLAASTSPAVCGGVSPCSATNQINFVYEDQAGNTQYLGPFGILVDTLLSQPYAGSPVNGAIISTNTPLLTWSEKSIEPIHYVQISTGPTFTTFTWSTATTKSVAQPPALTSMTTYYWRVEAQDSAGLQSPFSNTNQFIIDLVLPTASNLNVYNATAGVITEGMYDNLALGATAQIIVQDLQTGLAVSTGVLPFMGDGHDNPGSTSGYGVMYTTNAGTTWVDFSSMTATLSGTGETYVISLAQFNGLLFAGTNPSGKIYSSADGAHWNLSLSGTGEDEILSMAVFNGTLYAGTSPGAKVYSTVDGLTWNQVYNVAGQTDVRSLAAFDGRLYLGAGGGASAQIYSTTDGMTWTLRYSPAGQSFVQTLAVFNGQLYAGTTPGAQLYSTPNGVNWTQVLTAAGQTNIQSLAVFNGQLYAGTLPGAQIYQSPNGVSWTNTGGLPGENGIQSFSVFNGKLYAGTSLDGKIFASPDGSNWGQVFYGSGETYVYSLAPFNGNLYAGTIPDARVYQLKPNNLSLTGVDGSISAQTLKIQGMALNQATSSIVCGGVYPCGATDQLAFTVSDRAGNTRAFGPYAVLVDTSPSPPQINSLTSFTTDSITVVLYPVQDNLSGIKDYQYYLSTTSNFAAPVTTSPFAGTTTYTFAGLAQVTTYYIRAVAQDNLLNISPYSVTGATQTIGVMFFSTYDITTPNALQGIDTPMMKVSMYTAPGPNAIFNQIQITRSGGVDADVTQAELWVDNNDGGNFGLNAVELAVAPFVGGLATINLGGNTQNIGTTPQNYFVLYNIAQTGIIGDGLRVELVNAAAIGFANPYRVPGTFPITTSSTTIQDGPNPLIITPLTLAPGTAAPGAFNVPMMRLRMQTPYGTSAMSQVVLHLVGTATSNEISAVRIYRDINDNGIYDPGIDGLVTSGNDLFVNGASTLVFTAQASSVTVGPTSQDYFIVFNLALTAADGDTFGVQLTTGTQVTLTGPDTAFLTVSPATSTLTQVVQPNNLYVSMLSTIPNPLSQGGEYSVMKASFNVDAAFALVSGIRVNRIGSGLDSDISRVSIWLDGAPPSAGGYFNPGIDIMLGTAPVSGGAANVLFPPETLNSGTTYVMFVVYDINPLANPGDTVGARLTNGSYITIASTATTLVGTFPAQSSTATINAVVNTLLIPTALDETSGGLLQGATNMPMLRLDVRSNQNEVAWTGFTVQRTGTGTDAEVSKIKVYIDANANGTLDIGTDTLVSSGNDVFAGGQASINFPISQIIGTSSVTYFVAMSITPTATPGDTVGVSITTTTSFNLSFPDVVSSYTAAFPLTGGPVVINQYPNAITVTTTSISPVQAAPGATNVGLLKLVLNTNVSFATWEGLKLDRIGGTDADVASVKVYYDINQIGSWNAATPGQYLLLTDTMTSFGSQGTPGTVNLAFSTVTALSPTLQTYFVAIDLSTQAHPTDLLAARILSQVYYTVTAPNSVLPTFAQSANMLVATPPSLMNFVAASSAPAGVLQGATNVPMETMRVSMQQYTGTWTGMTILRTGTAQDTDVLRVKMYYDTLGTGVLQPLLDTLVGTATFVTGQAQMSFGVSQNITATSTNTYFLVYDISAVSNTGVTVGATIGGPGSINIMAPNGVLNVGFPYQSSLTLISPTESGVYATMQDKAPGLLLQGSTSQLMATLTMNTTIYSVIWDSIQLVRTGSASDTDITAIHIYEDINGDGTVDPNDPEITSGNDKFIGGIANIGLGLPQTISLTAQAYLITVDVSLFGCTTCTVGIEISSAVSFGVPPPNYIVNSGFPFDTSQPNIVKKPDTLVTNWINEVPTGGINQGVEIAMGMVGVSAQRQYVNWVTMRLGKQGSLSDGFVDQVRVYLNPSGDGAIEPADVVVGTGTFAGGVANITFNSVQTITTSSRTYVVSFVFDVNATVGATIGVKSPDTTYELVQSPDNVSSVGLPFLSTTTVILDARTPTTPVIVLPGAYWADFGDLPFVWTSSVALGGITAVSYALGTSPGAANIQAWGAILPLTNSVSAGGLTLATDSTYYVSVRAQSSFGFLSPTGISAPILVDLTVPSAPSATAQTGPSSVLISWLPVPSGPSGLMGYEVEYQNGTNPTWINAKGSNGVASVAAAGSSGPLTPSQLVQSNSFSFAPPGYATTVKVMAVSGAGVVGPPSPPMTVLFGTPPTNAISSISSYPNPFDSRSQTCTITYLLNAQQNVTIKIFSIYGNQIKTLSYSGGGNGGVQGINTVYWDGTDDSGKKTSKGIYVAVFQSGGTTVDWKIGLIH
jgi:hypothetical protein